MFSTDIIAAAESLFDVCLQRQTKIVTAESCTGGLIAAAMTALPGSSQVVDRGFVVYSNESKTQQLGVPAKLIEQHGAVSEQVAIAMAQGAIARSQDHAQLSIAVTGVAGPSSSDAKPVGLVHVAVARMANDKVWHQEHRFGEIGREQVRIATVVAGLQLAAACWQ